MSDIKNMKNSIKKDPSESSGLLLQFFVKYGKVLIIFSLILLVTVIGVVIFNEVQRSRVNQATILLESLEESYIDFLTSEDSDSYVDRVVSLSNSVITQFSNTYFHQRALLIKGLLLENQENNIQAAETFLEIAQVPVDSHLVEIGLIRSYQNFEAANNLNQAIFALEELLRVRPQGIQVPRSLFNIARLYELHNDVSRALEYYQRLVIEFPVSSWTNLAQARILFLQR